MIVLLSPETLFYVLYRNLNHFLELAYVRAVHSLDKRVPFTVSHLDTGSIIVERKWRANIEINIVTRR